MKKMNVKFQLFALVVFSTVLSFNSCKKNEEIAGLPVVTTMQATQITDRSVITGGLLKDIGSSEVTDAGICLNETGSPSVSDQKITMRTKATAPIDFSSIISGLKANTKYFARSYATNSKGTAYGDEINFTTKKASTFSASIGGVSYVATQIQITKMSDMLVVTTSNGSKSVLLWIENNASVGNHLDSEGYSCRYYPNIQSTNSFGSSSGNISISANDLTTGQIKGTFSFVVNDGQTDVSITNGQFDVYR